MCLVMRHSPLRAYSAPNILQLHDYASSYKLLGNYKNYANSYYKYMKIFKVFIVIFGDSLLLLPVTAFSGACLLSSIEQEEEDIS